MPEFYRDDRLEDPVIFDLYQIRELSVSADPMELCTLFINPHPNKGIQFAGDTAFWQSYDHESNTAAIWTYDPDDVLADESFPKHHLLDYTTIEADSPLIGFVVSEDGTQVAWARTIPIPDDDHGYVYRQEIWMAEMKRSGIKQVLDLDVPEDDGQPHVIRLRSLSLADGYLYYSDEPVGLGTSWPYPLGRYSSLYRIPVTGGDSRLLYECPVDHWCISDYSLAQDLIAVVQDGAIQLISLEGESVATISPELPSSYIGRGKIGPDGDLVFMVVVGDPSGETSRLGDAITRYLPAQDQVYVYHLPPPYDGVPQVILSSPGIRRIAGWAAADRLVVEYLVGIETPNGDEVDDFILIAGLYDGSADMFMVGEYSFEGLLP
jgi:hypothetical protein